MHAIGECRDNALSFSKKNFKFKLLCHIDSIMKEYSQHTVHIFGGSPKLSLDIKSVIPNFSMRVKFLASVLH